MRRLKKFDTLNSSVDSAQQQRKVPPRVALIVETSTLFGRKLLFGVAQYIRENGPWSVYFTDRAVEQSPPAWLKTWQGDGIISRIAYPEVHDVIRDRGIPIVDLNEQLRGLGVPLISNDHAAVGKLAAEHLLERGFQQFAFIGHTGHSWSDRRGEVFSRTVQAHGYRCEVYPGQGKSSDSLREAAWQTDLDSIAAWAATLPKPVGIMACTDFRAVQLLTACRLADIAIPEQAAVIGVGSDDVACALADPPLSSVNLNARRMGYEAASLLDTLMNGGSAPVDELLIPPLDITVRRSTDVTAISDPLVASAIRFIRERVSDSINVEDVLTHLGVSRTSLQNRFRAIFEKSIHDVLIDTRLAKVKELLAETTLPIDAIAARCGFRHPEYMSSAFKLRTGWTPGSYRRQHGVTSTNHRGRSAQSP
ncbi:DNA-binding transcriptional regulator [Granulicella sp. dw_53]|uniref:XylR family transcriptional regulator n=1 Tax=Granulicella sp. dw_53 TaxID=2719792 RepID=UPI001BD5FBF3|nr:DNA-binding transcriptional regulator [Granulicella sp. dw_53]